MIPPLPDEINDSWIGGNRLSLKRQESAIHADSLNTTGTPRRMMMNPDPTRLTTAESKPDFFKSRKPSPEARQKLRQYERLLHDLMVEMCEHQKMASWAHLD